jgi:hypothetical protein
MRSEVVIDAYYKCMKSKYKLIELHKNEKIWQIL